MKFSKTICQAWKVIRNNVGYKKSWGNYSKFMEFYNYLHKLLAVMQNQRFIICWIADSCGRLATTFDKRPIFLLPTVLDCRRFSAHRFVQFLVTESQCWKRGDTLHQAVVLSWSFGHIRCPNASHHWRPICVIRPVLLTSSHDLIKPVQWMSYVPLEWFPILDSWKQALAFLPYMGWNGKLISRR